MSSNIFKQKTTPSSFDAGRLSRHPKVAALEEVHRFVRSRGRQAERAVNASRFPAVEAVGVTFYVDRTVQRLAIGSAPCDMPATAVCDVLTSNRHTVRLDDVIAEFGERGVLDLLPVRVGVVGGLFGDELLEFVLFVEDLILTRFAFFVGLEVFGRQRDVPAGTIAVFEVHPDSVRVEQQVGGVHVLTIVGEAHSTIFHGVDDETRELAQHRFRVDIVHQFLL